MSARDADQLLLDLIEAVYEGVSTRQSGKVPPRLNGWRYTALPVRQPKISSRQPCANSETGGCQNWLPCLGGPRLQIRVERGR
jgi:hypothetical protein